MKITLREPVIYNAQGMYLGDFQEYGPYITYEEAAKEHPEIVKIDHGDEII